MEEEEEEEPEDLPDVGFGRILKMNKPEWLFMMSKQITIMMMDYVINIVFCYCFTLQERFPQLPHKLGLVVVERMACPLVLVL